MGNPFLDDFKDLVTLDSRNRTDKSVVNTVLILEETGKRQYQEFIKKVLEERTRSIHDPIKRNALALFRQPRRKTMAKHGKKDQNFGKLHLTGTKSDLLQCLEHPGQPEPPSTYDCKVLDRAVIVHCLPTLFCAAADGSGPLHGRHKREWIIPPRKLKENFDYTGYEYIAKIRSDKEYSSKVTYSLTGSGANDPPVNLFTVDPNTGLMKITGILDRETTATYDLLGVAQYSDGSRAEADINIRVEVQDENDCAPVFAMQQMGYVAESSAAGTLVMRVNATDADEPNTLRTQIYYSIVETVSSRRMFSINYQTGDVMVLQNTLDRETQDTYTLTVKGADMNGAAGGNSGSGTITIKVMDINDNVPTLEEETYVGSVKENTVDVEVVRIRAIDLDQMYSDNWLAVFSIVSGNEAGYFTVTTDSKTNEGIVMIRKALNYEEIRTLRLVVTVANKAKYSVAVPAAKPYPITINVINEKEGPRFQPSVKVVTISEDQTTVSINKVITNYAAIDSDTLEVATNVRYAKLHDIDNWLIIDENTGDVRLNKLPDRESKYLSNGTYYAKIICITNEMPSKTATGTIAIQVEDFNDHCPRLTSTTQTMCYQDNAVYVTAVDEDEFPNSAPFGFSVIHKDGKQKWTVEHFNETTSILRDHASLWPGSYKVTVEVKDQQGKLCDDVQELNVIVCSCLDGTKTCVNRQQSTATFGAPGVLLLLLGLLLLLLVPLLLLFCLCGGAAAVGDFKALPFETKQELISYHTEGQGEDKDVPLLQVPAEVDHGMVTDGNVNIPWESGFFRGVEGGAKGAGGAIVSDFISSSTVTAGNVARGYGSHYATGQMEMDNMDRDIMRGQGHLYSSYRTKAYDGLALSEYFLEDYYSSKSNHAAQQSQMKDTLLMYDYEGQESPAGSVGCCSLLDNEDDLEFLNDLGPKFRTLAEICQGSAFETVDVTTSVRPPKPVLPTRPSTSTHTHTHTHTEAIRDRDHTKVNTLNTSNVASESSTIIKERLVSERAQGIGTTRGAHVQENIVIPNQTLLIQQQPTVYYASTPMYVVEPQSQMMLVTGGAQQAMSHVGQGLVQVGGLHGSQGMVLVENQVGVGGGTGLISQGMDRVVTGLVGCVTEAPALSQGSISTSKQVLLVEKESAASSGVGSGAGLVQAILQTRQTSSDQGLEARGHGAQVIGQSLSMSHSSQGGSAGSNEDFALKTTPAAQGSQRVVVQQKKMSVIERNLETSTRA
ncbi:LOW QUALITY PROTEIN: desmoglein-2-like protein [Lampris incognitus]|uniref:LOW QUALITY PROTEIN: desmoglein-2-like protein n=1 Tax=Lampris incognitus TaxID=2546036 RepID=UPI0024B5B77A|nr:LOW QUALITY PROTEIN: desmoglein-2-like protein [Lampris incognitus]